VEKKGCRAIFSGEYLLLRRENHGINSRIGSPGQKIWAGKGMVFRFVFRNLKRASLQKKEALKGFGLC